MEKPRENISKITPEDCHIRVINCILSLYVLEYGKICILESNSDYWRIDLFVVVKVPAINQ